MNTTDDTNAARRGSGSNDLLGPASEARWYCLDRDGVAMPCKDEADAVDARRGLNRPPTPVGWSDTDWLKHLEEIRPNEAAYVRGPLPERGWD